MPGRKHGHEEIVAKLRQVEDFVKKTVVFEKAAVVSALEQKVAGMKVRGIRTFFFFFILFFS